MLRLRKVALVVFAIACLVAPGAAVAQVNHRPIEDFLNAQVVPPLTFWGSYNYTPARWVGIDYTGWVNQWLISNGHPDLGTTIEGDVTERELPDGQALVHVMLHGRNVFFYGMLDDGSPLFGYNRVAVKAGLPAALGEVLLNVEFVNPAGVGGPLPDLNSLLATPGGEPDVLLSARAEGEIRAAFGVPEGTPGRLTCIQRALYPTGQGVPGLDYWPAEIINIQVVGQ